MKVSSAFGLLTDLWLAFREALLPTIYAIFKSPMILVRPHELSRIFMAHVWKLFGPGIDENSREIKEALIRPNATGVVLDIGAGRLCPATKFYPAC